MSLRGQNSARTWILMFSLDASGFQYFLMTLLFCFVLKYYLNYKVGDSQRTTISNATVALATSYPSGTGWLPCASRMSILFKKLFWFKSPNVYCEGNLRIYLKSLDFFDHFGTTFEVFSTFFVLKLIISCFGDRVLISRSRTEDIVMLILLWQNG